MSDESARSEQNAQNKIPAPQPQIPQAEAKAAPPAAEPPKLKAVTYAATGRRKTAVARVRMMEGTGKILVNKQMMQKYFHRVHVQRDVLAPLRATKTMGRYDVVASVTGGGETGQAGALVLGIARALLRIDSRLKEALQGGGWLTRDSRIVERKKYGRHKARRSTQYSKR